MRATFECRVCGQTHDGPALAYHADAPVYWDEEAARDPHSELSGEQCIIGDEHCFVRGLIQVPVVGSSDPFEWGVWVSLSAESFDRVQEMWAVEGREDEPPYFGWLATELPVYSPSTVNLKTQLHTRPVGLRPLVELEATDHPLSIEQRDGITLERVRALAELLLHG